MSFNLFRNYSVCTIQKSVWAGHSNTEIHNYKIRTDTAVNQKVASQLDIIADFIRKKLPLDAILPSERIVAPTSGEVGIIIRKECILRYKLLIFYLIKINLLYFTQGVYVC